MDVNLSYDDCVKTVMEYKNCSYEDAKEIADYPQPFDDIAKQIYWGFEPDYVAEEPGDIRNAARLIANHCKRDKNFRNAFAASIDDVLRNISANDSIEDVAQAIADRIIGEE